jgi:hypothetical protein
MLDSESADDDIGLLTPSEEDGVQLPWPIDEFLAKAGPQPAVIENRRRFARIYYRTTAALLIKTSLPAVPRPKSVISVFVADIARGGIGLLVDRVFYPEERLTLNIPTLGLKQIVVRRCRRLGDRCFELGAEFGTEQAGPTTST